MMTTVKRPKPLLKPLQPFLAELTAIFGDRPRPDELLSGHTTSRLGGPADIWLAITTLTELVEAVTLARQYQVPLFMLGGGANLLITDGGIQGLVLENRANKVHFPTDQPHEPIRLMAESGMVLPNLARRCAGRGLSGFEWAVGVPGTVGGAVVNNAGAYGSDIATTLIRAELLSPAGECLWQPVTWFDYTYRSSRLKRLHPPHRGGGVDWIVLQAEFGMTYTSVAEVKSQINAFNTRRKSSQPPGATLGSMFKNPSNDYAGRLIEAAGLKGHQIGQAQISLLHANFFQNLGGATTADMLALIDLAQSTVEAKFEVKLELEIEVVGEFST